MLFTINERVISYCNHATPWSFNKYICLSLCLFLSSCFHAVKGIHVKAYLDTIKMTLAGLCLVVLGFLRTKKDSHGKATNTEEQKEKKRKKEQKAVTVTKGIRETKKKNITVALVSLDIFVLLLKWKGSFFQKILWCLS